MKIRSRCDNMRWVCEAHPERPWIGEEACNCGAPGVPCPACNKVTDNSDEFPALPDGFVAHAIKGDNDP